MNILSQAWQKITERIAAPVIAKSMNSWASLFSSGGSGGGRTPAHLSKPYAQSVWIFRAIQTVAAPVAACELKWSDEKDQPIDDPDLRAFWKMPATNMAGKMTRRDFVEASIAWICLNGQALWVLDDSWLDPRSKVKSPLYLARPDRLTPIRTGDRLLGWNFIDADQNHHLLIPEQVIRPGFYNPYDELLGLPPWLTAAVAAGSDYAAGLLAKNLMEANGDRGAYVIAKDGVVSDTQRQQIEAMLRNKRELARRGEFKTAFLTGNITVEDPKVQAMDAQFVAQRLENRHEIYAAFGIPMSMADVTASYSVGSASDWFRLIVDTCMPMAAKVAEAFDEVERRRSSLVRVSHFDFSNHPVMQQVRQERAAVADKLIGRGMPVSIANDWLDLGIPEFEGWEIGYLPISCVPVSGEKITVPATPAPQADQEKITRSLDNLEQLFLNHRSTTAPPDANDANDSDPERDALWDTHMKLRAPYEKLVTIQFRKWCSEMRKECLSNLEGGKALGDIQHCGVMEIVFDLGKSVARLLKVLTAPLSGAFKDAAKELGFEIGAEDPWHAEDKNVVDYLDQREPRIKGIAEEVWGNVKDTVKEGLEGGESNAKIADRIKTAFDGISKQRAKTIANTEVATAYGSARQQAMKGNGVKWKEWLTAGDEKVRAAHIRANNQQQPVDDPFEVDGEHLLHPGDPAGSAGNVINCRCVSIAIRKPKESS